MGLASSSEKYLRSKITSKSSLPGQYSITIIRWSASSKTASNWMMLGWCRRFMMSTSRRRRMGLKRSRRRRGRKSTTFTAKSAPVARSRHWYTVENPPLPSSRMTSYLLRKSSCALDMTVTMPPVKVLERDSGLWMCRAVSGCPSCDMARRLMESWTEAVDVSLFSVMNRRRQVEERRFPPGPTPHDLAHVAAYRYSTTTDGGLQIGAGGLF
mmetsp:Transcript_33789/g.74413  ORF Transcript_33789/g.74413 Transcript_33789/m.74413 type:complete len:212 (+) Transcript_33789:2392-3027(+)